MGLIDVIDNSLWAAQSEGRIELRRRDVAQMEVPHRRRAVQSVDAVIFFIPKLINRIEKSALKKKGFEYVASGAEARVFRFGENVLKYVHGTEKLDVRERAALRDRKEAEFDLLRQHMADFVLEQDIAILPHLSHPEKEAVVTTQPYVSFGTLIQPRANTGEVVLSTDIDAALRDDLSNFVDAAHALYAAHGLRPDTNGIDNIVNHNGRVVLIDTQPIRKDDHIGQRTTRAQIDSIAELLEKAA